MRFSTLALGLLGAAAVSASDVEDLKADTFNDFVKSNDLVLAECRSLPVRRNPTSYTCANLSQSLQYVPLNLANRVTLLTFCFFQFSHGG